MFNSFALIQYFEDNKNLPHISKYHRENCKEHCMLVIDAMAERTKDRTMLIAACLHDIAKPRTQALNKIGEPCFYGHDEVTDDDIAPFLTAEDECYAYVKALIFCHMVPYKVENAKDYDKALRKECRRALRKVGIEGVEGLAENEEFISNVLLLHECDDAGSIRKDENLHGIDVRVRNAENVLACLQ